MPWNGRAGHAVVTAYRPCGARLGPADDGAPVSAQLTTGARLGPADDAVARERVAHRLDAAPGVVDEDDPIDRRRPRWRAAGRSPGSRRSGAVKPALHSRHPRVSPG